jgi:hypothetical protein
MCANTRVLCVSAPSITGDKCVSSFIMNVVDVHTERRFNLD